VSLDGLGIAVRARWTTESLRFANACFDLQEGDFR